MSDEQTTIAACGECCGAPRLQPTQPGTAPAEPTPVPEPPAAVPTAAPPIPAGAGTSGAQAIASWPVRVPLANGSWVWMTVPYPMATTTETEPAAAAPTTEPIGHDATRPPGGAGS